MVSSNPERENRVHELWQRRHTIDEISLMTGIPRSTAGYYVRKFNRDLGRRGASIDGQTVASRPSKDGSGTNSQNAKFSVYRKIFSVKSILEQTQSLCSAGKYDLLYYLLNCIKLFPGVMRLYEFTPEEEDALEKLWTDLMKSLKIPVSAPPKESLKDNIRGSQKEEPRLGEKLRDKGRITVDPAMFKTLMSAGYLKRPPFRLRLKEDSS